MNKYSEYKGFCIGNDNKKANIERLIIPFGLIKNKPSVIINEY